MRILSHALPALLAFTFAASASTIAGPINFQGNATGTGFVVTPSPGNNNVPGGNSPNLLVITESVNALGSSWTPSFSILANAASTEYSVTKIVLNNTGQTWDNFSLYFGAGSFFDPNLASVNSGILTFDTDSPIVLSGAGTNLQSVLGAGPNYMSWGNLSVAGGTAIAIQFSVDTCANCSGSWVLSQLVTPGNTGNTVPEPGMFALVGIGLIGIRFRHKLRR